MSVEGIDVPIHAERKAAAPTSPTTPGLVATWPSMRLPTWTGMLFVVVMWMLVRPYRGVRHDGILYIGQTLAHLMPESIGKDLFLVYGSQDRYSIFSYVMAPLIQWLGVGLAQVVVLAATELLFVFGFWKLTAGLGANLLRWCAMLSLVALSHTYGGKGAFSFAEPFLTARAMAEPFVLLGLVCLLDDRLVAALLFMLVGAAVHPLIALPGLAVGWIYLALTQRRWLWLGAVVAAPLLLGAVGVTPFEAFWRRFDPSWWSMVTSANPLAFVRAQTLLDWMPTLFDVGVLWFGARALASASASLRRLVYAVLIGEVVFFTLWALGADVLHDVLITQLQLWRVFWLSHLLAVLLLPLLLVDEFRRGPLGRWSALAIALAAVAVTGNIDTGWACVAWAAVAMFAQRRQLALSRTVLMLAGGVTLVGLASVSVVVAHLTIEAISVAPERFNGVSSPQVIVGLPVTAAIVGTALLLGLAIGGLRRAAAMCVLVALAGWACTTWDQRSDWQRFVESGFQSTDVPFAGRIPAQATVYWDGSILEPWLLLHRADYFSQQQGSGLLFNRETAVEYERRLVQMSPLAIQQQVCTAVTSLVGSSTAMASATTCAPSESNIAEFCRIPGGPDFFVFRTDPSDPRPAAVARWTFRGHESSETRSYSLYDCAKLR